MTPTEMARVILLNIEATRALMEDGHAGYVLKTADDMNLICQKGDGNQRLGPLRLDHPQSDDVAVYTSHARAVTAQRWWNSNHPDRRVLVTLRREALTAYIERQQEAHNTLLTLIAMEQER